MKTFEENWTAWLDGELTGKELAEFEASLPDKAAAELEKQDALKLGAFLKEQLAAPAMTNEEFFHHQLRSQIESQSTTRAVIEPAETHTAPGWWSLSRLLGMATAVLAISAASVFFFARPAPNGGQSTYLTQIINARVDPAVSPNATISMFETKEDRVTVLWVNGLESLPSEYAAK